MRFTKVLSVFLAALMLFSCVAGALATGVVAAEGEGNGSEANQPVENHDYSDPRTGAQVTTYYVGSDAEFEAAGITVPADAVRADSVIDALCLTAYHAEWADDAVLEIKFATTDEPIRAAANDKTNGKSTLLFLGCATIFRANHTKLPIVVEGVGSASMKETTAGTANASFANDFYLSNFTFNREAPAKTGQKTTYYAGVSNTIFHKVVFGENSGSFYFCGDNYYSEPFYGWGTEELDANMIADETGTKYLHSSFTFGEDTSLLNGSKTAPTIVAVGADGHSGSGNYKANYIANAVKTGLTDTILSDLAVDAAAVSYSVPSTSTTLTYGTKAPLKPTETKTAIIINTRNTTDNTTSTAEFAAVDLRAGCNPVASSTVKLVSGNLKVISLDTVTASSDSVKREIYTGDVNLEIYGGCISDCIQGLYGAFLDGDINIKMTAGYVKLLNGCVSSSLDGTSITGDYRFTITGGEIATYAGATPLYGSVNKCYNTVSGGKITDFAGARYTGTRIVNVVEGNANIATFYGGSYGSNNITSVENTFRGGAITAAFYGGSRNGGTVTTLTNTFESGTLASSTNRLGGAKNKVGTLNNNFNGTTFNGAVYCGPASAAVTGTITNTVTDGVFKKLFAGGSITATGTAVNIVNTISGGEFQDAFFGTYAGPVTTKMTNTISGGLFKGAAYLGARNAGTNVAELENIITGGEFQSAVNFSGEHGTAGTLTSKITGGYDENIKGNNDYPLFSGIVRPNASDAAEGAENAVLIISDGCFNNEIEKGEKSTIKVVSDKEDNVIKFNWTGSDKGALTLDEVNMTAGEIYIYKYDLTINNASGNVSVRNIGGWDKTDNYSVRFVDAVNAENLTITPVKSDSYLYDGKVEVNGNDKIITCGELGLNKAVSARLIMDGDSRIGIEFFYKKGLMDQLKAVVGNINYKIQLGEDVIAEGALDTTKVTKINDLECYSLTTYGIGLGNFNNDFQFIGGGYLTVSDANNSLLEILEVGIEGWNNSPETAKWATWGTALNNLYKVAKMGAVSEDEADMTVIYDEIQAPSGDLDYTNVSIKPIMDDITGVKVVYTLANTPANVEVYVGGTKLSDSFVEVKENEVTVVLGISAQNMVKNTTVKVVDGEQNVTFTFCGAEVAKMVYNEKPLTVEGDKSAALLWYIQTAIEAIA